MIEQSERMQRLLQVGRELSTTADLRSVWQLILAAAKELTGSEAAGIMEIRSDGKSLNFLSTRPEVKSLETLIIPLEGSVAGVAFRKMKTVSLHDVTDSPQHFKVADQVSGTQTRSILACPILFRGEALGVMELINKLDGTDYNGDDVTILETLAAHASLAVQNARLQTLLEKTQEEARRLDKMKSDFVAITSHELRTPLGLILGHATFLHELIEDEHKPQLDTIIKNAMRLKEIIENMSSVDNAQSGLAVVRRRTFSIRKLIHEVVEALRTEAAEKKVVLGVDLDDSDLVIEGDAEKIKIVLTNLIKNGITFTNEKGHVFVVAQQLPEFVKVAVVDDGVGIPSKDVPHVFERFFQVESHLTRKHGGMGVGLSVAKLNIEMHGGRIWAESAEGKGSIFTFIVPLDSAVGKKVFTTS